MTIERYEGTALDMQRYLRRSNRRLVRAIIKDSYMVLMHVPA